MQDFRNLKVWQKSHGLVLKTYAATANFPATETFGITAQVRRAAVSIAANIAEGSGRSGDREFAHFLSISLGSASELEYFAILTADLHLMEHSEAVQIRQGASEIKRMLAGLIATLRHRNRSEG